MANIKKRQRVTVREITIVQYRPRRLEDQRVRETQSLFWTKKKNKSQVLVKIGEGQARGASQINISMS